MGLADKEFLRMKTCLYIFDNFADFYLEIVWRQKNFLYKFHGT
jgi:hypothetical protein